MFFSQHDVSGLDRFCVVLLLVSCFHHGSAADVGTDPAAQNSSGPLQWPLEDGWNLFEGKDIENSEGRYYTPNNTWLPLPAIPNLNTSEGLVDTYILFTFQVPAVGPGQDAELSFDYLDDNDKELADPGELTKFYSNNTQDMLRKLIPWLRSSDFLVTTPYDRRDYLLPSDTPVYGFENSLCPRSRCSSREWCEPFYKAFFLFLAVKPSRDLESWPASIADDFFSELTDNYRGQKAPNPFLSCPIVLTPDLGSFAGICASLGNDPYFKNATLWTDAEVTLNLEVFKKGGLDTQRVRWEGLQSSGDSNETLVSALYRNLLSVPNYDCDLRNPCRLPLDCEKVGSRSALGLSGTIYTELWPYLVLVAIQNFNQALTNQFNAIDSAAIRATLDTFTIDGFFPSPSPKVDLTNSLSNLGTIFSVLSLAPVPGVGSALSLGATFLPAVGTFYADKVATQVPADEPQRLFAPQVKAAYEFLLNAFYNVTYTLFHDGNINGVTLTDIIGTGDWLDSSNLQSLIDVQEQLKIEVLSHGLDGLWKSPPSNKMWVLYENLTGTGIDCASHNTGPSDSKYCADDGVYYAYNFLEKGDHKGVVGYPWGGEHLKDLGLEMSVCVCCSDLNQDQHESSAC